MGSRGRYRVRFRIQLESVTGYQHRTISVLALLHTSRTPCFKEVAAYKYDCAVALQKHAKIGRCRRLLHWAIWVISRSLKFSAGFDGFPHVVRQQCSELSYDYTSPLQRRHSRKVDDSCCSQTSGRVAYSYYLPTACVTRQQTQKLLEKYANPFHHVIIPERCLS